MLEERNIDKRRVRVFELEGDWMVLVGKSDQDNDYLSLECSRSEDLWFHVDGFPGSHVLLLEVGQQRPPRAVLEKAAGIAAWFSKARKAKRVGVGMARASDVGKRRGAPKGQVTVKKEEILRVTPGLP